MTATSSPAPRSPRGARLRRGVALLALLPTAFASLGAHVALADDVRNNVAIGGNDTVPLGSSTKVSYRIVPTMDADEKHAKCNVNGSNEAVLSIASGAVDGVKATISPTALTFKECNAPQEVTFSATKAGNYPINVSISPSTNFNTVPASFTLKVTGNTAPTVSVSGPVDTASYEKGSVPVASCNVVDKEDGNKTFAATLSAVTGSLASYGLGSQTASCSYTDGGGLTATAASTYRIVDTTKPTLTVPGDITEEATSSSGATATWAVTATDAVDSAPRTSCLPASGGTFALGSTAITCTATDVAGNTDTEIFNVLVQDTSKPVLSLPTDFTLEATSGAGAVATYTATASDTVDGPLTPSCSPASGSVFKLGGTPVNCSVSDKAGNPSAGGFTVTVEDTKAPNLTVPADITNEATGPSGAPVTFTTSASDVVDGVVGTVCDATSGAVFGIGTATVSCTATDKAGNETSKSFKVTVEDKTKPALSLPQSFTQEATSANGATVDYTATAVDVVDGEVTTFCAPVSGATFGFGPTTVECTATDAHQNQAAGSFTVTVADTTAPAVGAMPENQLLEATSSAGATATYVAPTATDAVDAAPAVNCSPASNTVFALGNHTVSCTATDATGNTSATKTFTITVQDKTAPAVNVPDSQTLEATGPNGATATWTGVSATDTVDGDVAATCDETSGSTFPLGPTVVTCSATDAAKNTASKTFTITVQDKSAPSVTVPENITKEATGPSGALVTWSGVSANDVVDGPVPASCDPASGSTFGLGTGEVTCSAKDKAGNTGSNAFTVTVQDTTPPAVTVPSTTVVLEATSSAGAPGAWTASATDLVDGTLVPSCLPAAGTTLALGDHTVTCTATDRAGKTGSGSFTVQVLDTTEPTLTVPASFTKSATDANGALVNYAASAQDAVDANPTVECSPVSGSQFALGATTVNCTATDAAGNAVSESFTVTVKDTTAPVINKLSDITAQAASAAGAVVTYTATASDNVDAAVNPSCTPASGTTFAVGTTAVTCTAKDAAGNISAPAVFKVIVGFDKTPFLAPVDGNKVLNGMKAGSTAPLKWQIRDGKGGFIGDLSTVKSTAPSVVSCASGEMVDDLAVTSTSGTSIRYDSTSNQYIYNWQSPKKAGTCYIVTVNFTDGTATSAMFQLR